MANLVFDVTIPDEKVEQALAGFLKLYPNTETMDDPDWENPGDGTPPPQVPKFASDVDWAKEKIRRNVLRDIRRGLQMIAKENTQPVDTDDMIVVNQPAEA